MKALITKDILQLKTYRKTLIVFLLIFVLVAFAQGKSNVESNLFTIMIAFGFGMFSLASFNYDEASKSEKYLLTLPVTKKDIVFSKYVLVIMSTILGAIIGLIGSVIIANVAVNFDKTIIIPNFYESIVIALGAIFGIGLIQNIQIPCIYKFGAEKGRIMIFIGVAILGLIGFVVYLILKALNINPFSTDIMNFINSFLPLIVIILTIIEYYISYKISYKLYCKKEV